MQFKTTTSFVLLASLLTSLASADSAALVSAINTLVTDAGTTDSAVQSFSSSQGLTGAIAIQTDSTQFSKDLDAAISAASGVDSSASADVSAAFAKLGAPVAQLLKDLGAKQSDFNTVGAASIVKNDLTELQTKSNNLIKAIFGIVLCGADADAVDAAGAAINAAYVSTNQIYSNANQDAPSPSCVSGGSSAAGSSAAGSAPATSAPVTSAPAGTVPPSNSTLPHSSFGNSTTSYVTTVYSTETVVTDCSTNSKGETVAPFKTTSTVTKTYVKTVEDCGCTEKATAAPPAKSTPAAPAKSTPVKPAPVATTTAAPAPVNGANALVANAGVGLVAIGAAALFL